MLNQKDVKKINENDYITTKELSNLLGWAKTTVSANRDGRLKDIRRIRTPHQMLWHKRDVFVHIFGANRADQALYNYNLKKIKVPAQKIEKPGFLTLLKERLKA